MPLTPFQREILAVLARRRTAGIHIGRGNAINRGEDSPRYSRGVDIFHDVAEAVSQTAAADESELISSGYAVTWKMRQPTMHQAHVSRDNESIGVDWCYDSAFRFFPIISDPEFGFVLHPADLATNKLLALAGRNEIRDFIDILHLDKSQFPLGVLAWAACGKDEGFNPNSLLDMAKRHVRFTKRDLDRELLRVPLDLQEMKREWTAAVERAEALIASLPAAEIGCLYIDSGGTIQSPDSTSPDFAQLIRHFGSIGGAWPTISEKGQ